MSAPAEHLATPTAVAAVSASAPASSVATLHPIEPSAAKPDLHETLVYVRLDALQDAPWQPRGIDADDALEALADSIGDAGVLEPALVRRLPDGQGYELLAGHRRRDAVRRLAARGPGERPPLPPRLRDPLDGAPLLLARVLQVGELEAHRTTLAENAHRADLCAWDRAHAVAAFRDALAVDSGGRPPEQKLVAQHLRLAESAVSESIRTVAAITPAVQDAASAAWGLSHDHPDMCHALRRLSQQALRRIARIGGVEERTAALRAALDHVRRKDDTTGSGLATPRRRASDARGGATTKGVRRDADAVLRERYQRLQAGEAFDFRRTTGLASYEPADARAQLDELAPAVGVLAARAAGGKPVVLETGGGGTVLVLPADPAAMSPDAVGAALAALIDLKQRLDVARAAHSMPSDTVRETSNPERAHEASTGDTAAERRTGSTVRSGPHGGATVGAGESTAKPGADLSWSAVAAALGAVAAVTPSGTRAHPGPQDSGGARPATDTPTPPLTQLALSL